jgi:hypothetical protein
LINRVRLREANVSSTFCLLRVSKLSIKFSRAAALLKAGHQRLIAELQVQYTLAVLHAERAVVVLLAGEVGELSGEEEALFQHAERLSFLVEQERVGVASQFAVYTLEFSLNRV